MKMPSRKTLRLQGNQLHARMRRSLLLLALSMQERFQDLVNSPVFTTSLVPILDFHLWPKEQEF